MKVYLKLKNLKQQQNEAAKVTPQVRCPCGRGDLPSVCQFRRCRQPDLAESRSSPAPRASARGASMRHR